MGVLFVARTCGGLVEQQKNIGVGFISLMQKIFKVNIKIKPETFLLGLMDKELLKRDRTLILYMLRAAKCSMHKNAKML